ncbi:adenosylmethionine-8-amino-7-oxononanoate aminotransferase [Tamilnaduibacter salinus]|uniref:Adenosylmethionine-8-amino-7-oxononanoate aminotransferase n=1 Tax=Tamilnaduibacter salinus TaxID=1484056 RepID=A0A2U1CVT5_9GAMM|nr:adenosylmethionine--8-amino-7-oxononanoate transaminase [Tamilnaduibacter salinus]PVY75820.1 adenosylmethionine-8-amino-7-oxononanoate aminotransferase [Tamilnaduibacter salinus]
MNNADLVRRDLNAVWHPCTQMKDHETLPLIPFKRGKGVWLEDFENNQYIDAVSSWWVNLFGHANPRINAAIREQTETLEHAMLAGFTHEPVINLSERLIEVTPDGLNKCFYADNGSSAIEAALKMSYHYWKNHGKPGKKNFVNLGNSYHGETLGALALGDVGLYKATYQPLLMEVFTAPSPDAFNREEGESWEDYAIRQFEHMERILAEHHDEICAVVVEPLVQCAGNMRMHHAIYHTMLRKACDKYDVHLIADEIAVGFGRTGTLFACEQSGISPDFMCLSKGLTAGYLPLSIVMTTNDVYDAFYDDYETLKAFLHSHSYTGNPIGCAVALSTLDIFRDDNVIERNKALAQCMGDSVAHLADHPHVGDIRQHGMTLAIELVKDKATKTPFPFQERRGIRVYQHSITREALLRPLGNVIYFMPPYVITESQIQHLAQVATEGIDKATRD